MLYVFLGTDREKARAALKSDIALHAKGRTIVRITDASLPEDIRAALAGPGLFGEARVLVFENISSRPDLSDEFYDALPFLSASQETVFLYEEKPLVARKRILEKYAAKVETHDMAKQAERSGAFSLADALKRGDRRALWVGYRREIMQDTAPEAVLGVLFWGAKDQLTRSGEGSPGHARALSLISSLASLPHEARRRGVELEYALERFLLESA